MKVRHPRQRLLDQQQRAADYEVRLRAGMEDRLLKARHRLALYIEKVKALSPLEKLNHGYAYVQDERGRSVRSISGICKGENLSVYVTDGVICAEVREVKEEKHG